MSQARDTLRDYLERRHAESAPPAVQEENLRRLLRHVAAARQPSERLEADLLKAMNRAARDQATGRQRRLWPAFRPAVGWWGVPALAAAVVVVAAVAWQRQCFPVDGTAPFPQQTVVIKPAPIPAPAPRAEPPLIGYVLLPEGELLHRAAAREEWRSAEGGDPIRLGDSLRTEEGAGGSIVFLDGSDCRLADGTTLTCEGTAQPEMKRPGRVQLARGEAWFQVEKGGPTFMVEAPAATAIVQGTYFGVAVEARGTTTLRVKEGAVRLRSPRSAVLVLAGRQSTAHVGGSPERPVPLTYPKPRPQPAPRPGVPTPGRTGGPAQTGGSPPGQTSHPTFEVGRPARRPADHPAPEHPTDPTDPSDPSEKPTAPFDSSGSAREPEPQTPITTKPPPR